MANEDGPTQARNLFQQKAEQQAQQMEADAAVEAINSSVPESGLQQLLRESTASFDEAVNINAARDISPMYNQQQAELLSNSIREAQKGSIYRKGVNKTTGIYTIDYALSKLPDVMGSNTPPAHMTNPEEYAYMGETGTYFLDSLISPDLAAHPHLFEAGGATRYKPIAVKNEDGRVVRVINMPHTKKTLSRDFVGNRDSISEEQYELLRAEVEKRGESISDYLAPDVFTMDVPLGGKLEAPLRMFDPDIVMKFARASARENQDAVDHMAANTIVRRMHTDHLEGEELARLYELGRMGDIAADANQILRPITDRAQAFFGSAAQSFKQTFRASATFLADVAGFEEEWLNHSAMKGMDGAEWYKSYPELVEVMEGTDREFSFLFGTTAGQIAAQMIGARGLGALGLPQKAGFIALGSGYSAGIVNATREQRYLAQGYSPEDADRMAEYDGLRAGIYTALSEMIVGGIGRFGKGKFLGNLATVVDDYALARITGGAIREAAQENLEEILQRAYFMTVRQDKELVDQDFFSPEFMEHMKKVGIASAFGGGLSGAAMDITTTMNLAPFAVGDQVVLLDGDTPAIYTVTNENRAELRKRQLQQYRHQQRIDLYNEPFGGETVGYIIEGLANFQAAKTRAGMRTRLEALGMPKSLIEAHLNTLDAKPTQPGFGKTIGAPKLADLFGDPSTPISTRPGDPYVGESKLEMQVASPLLTQFFIGLDSNSKEDATLKARQIGVGVGKRAELANLLSLMSEDDIGDMRRAAAESRQRHETKIQAGIEAVITPEAVPHFADAVLAPDAEYSDAFVDEIKERIALLAEQEGDADPQAIADTAIEGLLYPETMTPESKIMLDKVLGNARNRIRAQEVISNHFNPEVTEEVTTEPEGEETDVADPEGPRFSREAAVTEVAETVEAVEEGIEGEPTEEEASKPTRLGFLARVKARLVQIGALSSDATVEFAAENELSNQQRDFKEKMSKRGIKIAYVKGLNQTGVKGTINDETGAILLSAELEPSDATYNAITAHEVFHGVRMLSPKDAVTFMKAALENDREGVLRAFAYAFGIEEGVGLKESEVVSQMRSSLGVAKFGYEQRRVLEEAFAYYIEAMALADPAKARRLMDSLGLDTRNVPMLERMSNTIGYWLGTFEEFGPDQETWRSIEFWNSLHKMMNGFVNQTYKFGSKNEPTTRGHLTPYTAESAENLGEFAELAINAFENYDVNDADIAGGKLRAATYGFYDQAFAPVVDAKGFQDNFKQLYGDIFGSHRPYRKRNRSSGSPKFSRTNESEGAAKYIQDKGLLLAPLSGEPERLARRRMDKLDRSIFNRAIFPFDQGPDGGIMFSRSPLSDEFLTDPSKAKPPKFGEGPPQNAMDPKPRRLSTARTQLRNKGVVHGMPFRGMNQMNIPVFNDALNGLKVPMPTKHTTGYKPSEVMDSVEALSVASVEKQIDMANSLYMDGLIDEVEAQELVASAKFAADAFADYAQTAVDSMGQRLSEGQLNQLMLGRTSQRLFTNMGATFHAPALINRIAKSDRLPKDIRAMAESLLKSAPTQYDHEIMYVSANMNQPFSGFHMNHQTAQGMGLGFTEVNPKFAHTEQRSYIRTMLHELTHATTSATLNNTLMSVMMDEDADLTDKFFRLGAVGHLEQLTNPDEAMAARGRAYPKLIARSKFSAEGARQATQQDIDNSGDVPLGQVSEFDTSQQPSLLTNDAKHKLWVMRHKATANILGDFLVARAFHAYNVAGELMQEGRLDPDLGTNFGLDMREQFEESAKKGMTLHEAAADYFAKVQDEQQIADIIKQVSDIVLYEASNVDEFIASYMTDAGFRNNFESVFGNRTKMPFVDAEFAKPDADMDIFVARDALAAAEIGTPELAVPKSLGDNARRAADVLALSAATSPTHNVHFSRRLMLESVPGKHMKDQKEFMLNITNYGIRRKHEQSMLSVVEDNWESIAKETSSPLETARLVRGFYEGDASPGFQLFLDSDTSDQFDAAAQMLAFALDQDSVGVIQSIREVAAEEQATGLVIEGPASRKALERIYGALEGAFAEGEHGDYTAFGFPMDIQRKKTGYAVFNEDKLHALTPEVMDRIEEILGDEYTVRPAIIETGQAFRTDFAATEGSNAHRVANDLRQKLRDERNKFLKDQGYDGPFFSRGHRFYTDIGHYIEDSAPEVDMYIYTRDVDSPLGVADTGSIDVATHEQLKMADPDSFDPRRGEFDSGPQPKDAYRYQTHMDVFGPPVESRNVFYAQGRVDHGAREISIYPMLTTESGTFQGEDMVKQHGYREYYNSVDQLSKQLQRRYPGYQEVVFSRGIEERSDLFGNETLFSRDNKGVLDRIMPSVKKQKENVSKMFRKYFTTSRGLPQGAFRRYMQKKGRIEAEQDRAAKRLIELRDIVARDAANSSLEQQDLFNRANTLLGIPPDIVDGTSIHVLGPHPLTIGMSPEFLATIRSMRESIDTASAVLTTELDLPAGLKAVIGNNLGMYVTRSYKAFTEPDWAARVEPEVKDRFIEQVVGEFRGFFAAQIAKGELTDEQLYAKANVLVNDILLRAGKTKSPIAMLAALSESDPSSVSIFKKRRLGNDDFSMALRALLGEEKDVFKNYTNTITKMATVVSNHKLVQDIITLGTQKVDPRTGKDIPGGPWIRRVEDLTPEEATEYVHLHEGDAYKAGYQLNGYAVKPETKDALEFILQPKTDNVDGLMKFIFQANSLTKYGKTILSPITHTRNAVGNISFMVSAGYLTGNALDMNFREFFATSAAGNDLFSSLPRNASEMDKSTRERRRSRYRRLVALGVVNYGFEVEIEAMLNESGANESLGNLLTRVGRIAQGPQGLASRVINKAQKLYSFEDDFFKVVAFELELGRLKNAFPGRDIESLEQEAAEIVGQVLPNYEMVPEVITKLRRLPLLGTFPSFTAELIRTRVGLIKRTAYELNSDNASLRAAGRSRLIGQALMFTIPTAMAIAFKNLAGVSDEEEKAVRKMLPFWNKNSVLLFTRDENGEIGFIDYSYVDPMGYFRKPFIALLGGSNENVEEATLDAMRAVLDPFIGEEVFFGAVYQAIKNQDMNGRTIVEPGSDTLDAVTSLVGHVFKGIEPGFVGQGLDFVDALSGHVNDYGKHYRLGDVLFSHLTGFKKETINPMQAYMFRIAEFNRKDRELRSRLNASVRRAGEVTDDELRDAFQRYNDSRANLQSDLLSLTSGIKALGYSDDQIRAAMKFGYVNQELVDNLVDGKFTPYDVPVRAVEGAADRYLFTTQEVPLGEQGEAERRIRVLTEEAASRVGPPREIGPGISGRDALRK